MGRPLSRRVVSRSSTRAVVVVALALLATALACGTNPVGVDACRRIEKTRCESAQACGISLELPAHNGDTPEKNVASCIRYYDDQCLHGLVVTKEPGPQNVDACVDAIITGSCAVVRDPETHPACAFLIPPNTPDASATTADASADAEASAP